MAVMPITKGAIRKLRSDKRKTKVNLRSKRAFKEAVATMRRKPTPKNLTAVFSELDKAVRKHVVALNTAARLKSRLSRLVGKK